MNSNVKNLVFWLVILISAFLLWQTVKSGQRPQAVPEISYSDFLTQIEAGTVGKVTISGTHIDGQYRDGRAFRLIASASQEGMIRSLRDKNVEIWFRNSAETGWPASLLNIAPLILLAALWFFMIRQMRLRQNRAEKTTDFPR